MHRNENTTTQNLWDTVKAVLGGRFIAIQAYLKNKKKKPNKLANSTPKATRKGRNEKLQSQQKEINLKNQGRNKCKRNKRDHSKNQQRQKSWFFERIDKIDKPLARLIKKQREKNQIKKLEMKMERSQQTTQKYKGS